jgi:hypothetical protein
MDDIIVEGQLRKILPTKAHKATVIFNHVSHYQEYHNEVHRNDILQGLGQYNATWAHVVHQALAPQLPHVLWILPQSQVFRCRLLTLYIDVSIE